MSQQVGLDLQALASLPPWSPDNTRALDGCLRGSLLKDWGIHVERHWGPEAPAALIDALGFDLTLRPDLGRWYPVWVQLRLTELIIEHHLHGDAKALIPVIWEDAMRSAGPIAATALRLAGPVRILRRAPGSFSGFYDQVQAKAVIEDDRIQVRYTGPRHVDHPTWQLLQALSITGLFQMAGISNWLLVTTSPDPGVFELDLRL